MANRTAKDANTVKGTNPQYLIEKIIRMRIYDARYWKEECFALSAELIVDKGMELRFIGGVYGGNVKPTPFLCLILKLLQIQPDKDIIIEFIRQEDSKYVRALGAFYFRLIGTSAEIYNYLEPLFNDYRKLRYMKRDGTFEIMHMDELIDLLIRETTVFDVQMPRLQKREVLETAGQLEKHTSALEEDLANVSAQSSSSSDESDEERVKKPTKSSREKSRTTARSSPPSSSYPRRSSRSPDRDRRRRSKDRYDRRSRSKSRERTSRRSPDRSGGGSSHHRSDKDRQRERDRDRDREKDTDRGGKRTRDDSLEREIREANELRQKLGMAPLQR